MNDSAASRTPRIAERLNFAIHRTDPLVGIDPAERAADLQGWFDHSDAADVIIDRLRPNLIIEIGTWKGLSAAYMAKAMRRHHDDCAIICIDTWLGAAEHWVIEDWHRMMNCRRGYPDIYGQFLANMVHEGLQDVVVPLPLPSHQAALVLETYGIETAMIYLDGGHDYESVRMDLESFWPRLTNGGIVLGDDYAPRWPTVTGAVQDFRDAHKESIANFHVVGTAFILQKA